MGEPLTATASDDRRAKNRRERRFSLALRERRSGFDRRGRDGATRVSAVIERALLNLRERPRAVFAVLFAVNALNLADFLLTLNVLADGGGEANPLMRSLFALDPLYAGIFKVVAVFFASWLAWRCRRFRSGLEASLILLAVFSGVICYHIFGLVAYS
jgi:Domain of unknown function (DUF5658)